MYRIHQKKQRVKCEFPGGIRNREQLWNLIGKPEKMFSQSKEKLVIFVFLPKKRRKLPLKIGQTAFFGAQMPAEINNPSKHQINNEG